MLTTWKRGKKLKNSSFPLARAKRIRKKFLDEILEMYVDGEVSAGRAAEMLGVPRAAFYAIQTQGRRPLPEKLNQSILKELRGLKATLLKK